MHSKNRKNINKINTISTRRNASDNALIDMPGLYMMLFIAAATSGAITFAYYTLPSITDVFVLAGLLTLLVGPSLWIALSIKKQALEAQKAEVIEPRVAGEAETPHTDLFADFYKEDAEPTVIH